MPIYIIRSSKHILVLNQKRGVILTPSLITLAYAFVEAQNKLSVDSSDGEKKTSDKLELTANQI